MSLRAWVFGTFRAAVQRLPAPARRPGRTGVVHDTLEQRRLFSVAAVEVGSVHWSAAFRQSLGANQLGATGYRIPLGVTPAALPWSQLNQISVVFDGPSDTQAQDLLVAGVRVGRYPAARMTYDPATYTATWTLGRSVSNDKLLLRLRTAGGVFQSRINILGGDVNQTGGLIDAADVRATQARRTDAGAIPIAPGDPRSAAFFDVNGSGVTDALDVQIVRARLLTRLPEREPHVALPAMPTSDRWYGTVMNANQYIASEYHLPGLSPNLTMVTDLATTDGRGWVQTLARLRATHPNLLIGTYHSSRDAQPARTLTQYPRRAVAREGLTSGQILMPYANNPNSVIVDYSQPAARRYLVDQIVRDIVETGRPLAYLDNVSHHETGFPLPWATTMELVRDLTTNLHAMGKRVIVNTAWVPGYTAMESVDQFIATGADGVALEMGFYPFVRNTIPKIHIAMQQYRRMLDAGLTVALVPNAAGVTGDKLEFLETEQRMLAAFGMMFRKPGDRLFVSQIFWRPSPEWTNWPEKFGPALGEATLSTNLQGQIVMTRRFWNHVLSLNTATREVTVARRGGIAGDVEAPASV